MVNFEPFVKSDFLNMKIKDFAKLIHGKNKAEFVQIIKNKKSCLVPGSLFDKYATPEIEEWFRIIDGTGIDYFRGEICYNTKSKPNNYIEKNELYAYIRLNEKWENNKNLTEKQIDNMTIRELFCDFSNIYED